MQNSKAMYIFLLGRPGCGKSVVFKKITDKLKAAGVGENYIRVDDFPKLWHIFQTDKEWKRCRPTPDGGYKVTDNTVWDDLLVEVNKDLKELNKPGGVVFVEFSRPDYVHSLANFTPDIMENAAVLYIDCPFDICWARNVRRHEAAVAAGGDDHLVSREEMEKTYLNDDFEDLKKKCSVPFISIENYRDDLSLL
ncbi:MAG: hypothetical protein A2X49_09480, partial [Lentisphaerae bacterium GWF2_52_8]